MKLARVFLGIFSFVAIFETSLDSRLSAELKDAIGIQLARFQLRPSCLSAGPAWGSATFTTLFALAGEFPRRRSLFA
jgi:hypothetical protein